MALYRAFVLLSQDFTRIGNSFIIALVVITVTLAVAIL